MKEDFGELIRAYLELVEPLMVVDAGILEDLKLLFLMAGEDVFSDLDAGSLARLFLYSMGDLDAPQSYNRILNAAIARFHARDF